MTSQPAVTTSSAPFYKLQKNVPVSKPFKNPTRKPVPYWTDECIAAVKERNKAKNKMQQTRDLTNRQAYYKLKGVA